MGVILNGILGGVSGKVGGVVGSDWKGIKTLRSYAIPANPNTASQQTQRGKFAAIVSFAKLMLSTVIQPFWDQFAVLQSGFNAFCSANLLSWANDTAFDDAIIAQGNLESCPIDSSSYNAVTGVVDVAWTNAGLGNGQATDLAHIVIVDTANNIAFYRDTVTRQEEGEGFNIGADRIVANLKAYLFFTRGAGDTLEVSNSTYYQVIAA